MVDRKTIEMGGAMLEEVAYGWEDVKSCLP
jgi:hypothetical protein